MSIINFTVNYDQYASRSDTTDDGFNAEIVPLTGEVTFTALTSDNWPVLAPAYSPRPAGFKILPFSGYMDTDGRLKSERDGNIGVRLWANAPVFELERLVYKVEWNLRTPGGARVEIDPGYFEAPDEDIVVNLAQVLQSTGSSSLSVPPTFYTLGDLASPFGEQIVQAVDAADARDILKVERTFVDLRDWDSVRDANWKTFNGATYTVGSAILNSSTSTNGTRFTADDVGKVVMVKVNNVGAGEPEAWWMGTIVSVNASGAATLDSPITDGSGNEKVRYGFDGTDAINNALAEVDATSSGPVDVYLGGSYRLTQLVVPEHVTLRGVSWHKQAVGELAYSGRTILRQLPGAEDDFVVFNATPSGSIGVLFANGLYDFELIGPEKNVVNVADATTGNGVDFRDVDGTPAMPIDGFKMARVHTYRFPESGFRSYGAIPFYLDECSAWGNGRYGFEHARYQGNSTNALHIFNFSGDWNNLGLVGLRTLQHLDSVFISGLKSEGHTDSAEANTTRGAPNFQSNAIVIENCDRTAVLVNGVSHLRVGRAGTAAGPAITIRDTQSQGRRPRLTFNAVNVILNEDDPPEDISSAVTLRDETTGFDIPRQTVSGHYPTTTLTPMVDVYGNPVNYERLTALRTSFANKDDADSFVLGDDGTLVTITNVAPTIQDGLLQAALTGLTNFQSSYCVQPLPSADSIGATFKLSGSNAAVGLAFNETPIGKTPFRYPNSAMLLTIDPDSWRFDVYEGFGPAASATPTTVASGSFSPNLASDWNPATPGSGTLHQVDVLVSGSTATLNLPNGTTTTVTDARIASIPKNYVSHLLYRPSAAAGLSAFESIYAGAPKTMIGTELISPTLTDATLTDATLTSPIYIPAVTSTSTAAGTTTLTSASSQVQVFTGTATQSIYLPTTGITLGRQFTVINNSSSWIAIYASGGGGILSVPNGRQCIFTAISNAPTASADWLYVCPASNPAASTTVLRDVYANVLADNFISSRTATATAASTTTMTIESSAVQEFTGSTTQTVKLPTTSVTAGQQYTIINNSSGSVTVQSSGANTIATVTAGTLQLFVAKKSTPTAAADWQAIS